MNTIKDLMSKNIWFEKFERKLDSFYPREKCYCKEKRGRFDVSPLEGTSDGVLDRILKLERESEESCMYCGMHCRQIWIEKGRVYHICALCYVRKGIYLTYKKIEKWVKKILSGDGRSSSSLLG